MKKSLLFTPFAILLLALTGCKSTPAPEPIPLGPEPEVSDVTIRNRGYNLVGGRYELFHNRVTDNDLVHFYLDLTDNAGIILEAARELAGQRVAVAAGSTPWFLSLGGATGPYTSWANYRTDFEGFSGWFRL